MSPNGDFDVVYTWQASQGSTNQDIWADPYRLIGTTVMHQKGPNLINADPLFQDSPSVSMDNNGNAVIAYRSLDPSTSTSQIFANRFSRGGVVGAPIQVSINSGSLNNFTPSVALAPVGDPVSNPSNLFVVTFADRTSIGLDEIQVVEVGSDDSLLATLGPVEGIDPAISIDGFNPTW